jgi:hypothetical protein
LKQKNLKLQEILNDLTMRIEEGEESQSKLIEANKKLDVSSY